MRLRDLNPTLKQRGSGRVLSFDCPSGKPHKIRVHVHDAPYVEINGIKYWQMGGEFPDSLTISPSINEEQCWHGTISNGEAQ